MLKEAGSREEQVIAALDNVARNELQSVLGMLELIAQGPLTAAQSDYVRACKSSSDRLLRSVQNISMFLRPEPEEAQFSSFNLHVIMTEITKVMETLANRKRLGLSLVIRRGVPQRVVGDSARLQDILVRLLDNAIRFTECGSVELNAAEIRQDSEGHHIQFEVCDTGPGITADVIRSVSNSLVEPSATNGLGLPIVRKLVHSLGGDLTIGAQDAGGSRVSVSLPFGRAHAASGPVVEAAAGTTPPLNILVAEDSDDSYFVLEACLQEQKHSLTRAVSGLRAVELFKSGRYDLVLMDIHMPEMDGYTATHAIRTWETGSARARVPIVVLSADSHATQVQNGAQVGCSAYLTKPVSNTALLSVLRRFAARQSSAFENHLQPI